MELGAWRWAGGDPASGGAVLGPPFRPGPAHIVQFRPVGVGQGPNQFRSELYNPGHDTVPGLLLTSTCPLVAAAGAQVQSPRRLARLALGGFDRYISDKFPPHRVTRQ